jgi:acetyl esterase/lipase
MLYKCATQQVFNSYSIAGYIKKEKVKKIFVIVSMLFSVSLFAQEDTAVKKVVYPAGYEAQIDVVYNKGKGWEVKHDIYFNPKAAKPTAVVFNIHGGGWNHGTKESQTGFGSWFKMGFAVVNIEYRMFPQATAPAAVEDVRASIMYAVQHAKELNIDPNKIVIMGGSAGGHLALMAGLLQNDNKFDGDYKNVKGYTIAAIIDKYGPTDLTNLQAVKGKSVANWLGGYVDNNKFKESVSPIFYVKKTSPPVYIVHGDSDPTVPYQQSIDLKKKLDELGVKNQFKTIPGGVHGKFTKEQNTEISKEVAAFLRELGVVDTK